MIVTNANFNALTTAEMPVMIDVSAPWCASCKIIDPIVDSLIEEYKESIIIGKANADELDKELLAKYNIRNIPTILFFKDGEMVDKFVGNTTKDKFKSKLDSLI